MLNWNKSVVSSFWTFSLPILYLQKGVAKPVEASKELAELKQKLAAKERDYGMFRAIALSLVWFQFRYSQKASIPKLQGVWPACHWTQYAFRSQVWQATWLVNICLQSRICLFQVARASFWNLGFVANQNSTCEWTVQILVTIFAVSLTHNGYRSQWILYTFKTPSSFNCLMTLSATRNMETPVGIPQ